MGSLKHGTEAMYRKELRVQKKTGVPSTCLECTKAHARHVDAYRATKPQRDRSSETAKATARRRALNRLAAEFPGAFQRLLDEEHTRAGV